MLPAAILGIGLLIGFILVMRWYASADPAVLKRVLKLAAIWGLVLIALFLALTGRLAAAFGLLAGVVAFGWRLLNMVAMARQIGGIFGGLGGGFGPFGGSGQAAPGQSSHVDSRFLRMTLDHDTGAMDGHVLDGQFQGRVLSAMTLPDLLALRSEASGDADSLGLIEAYLDRAHVGWRADAGAAHGDGHETGSTAHASGPMTRDEAYALLGLEAAASAKDVKAAYRRLMAKVHPDKGGSAYLAAKINEAKDLLLNG